MDNEKRSYQDIIEPIKTYSNELEQHLSQYFSNKAFEKKLNPVIPIIKDFLALKGKRLRSNLIFLLTKALSKDVEAPHYKLALVQEFLHNATLIHDDIIDCSCLRRGHKTLNFEYDSKLAVLAGDYLLSEAMEIINLIGNDEIRKLHSSSLKSMIDGELHQYFNRFKILSIEEYIEKSKAKTARLFECGLVSTYLNLTENPSKLDNIRNFALHFGTAFQIKNDLDNFEDKDKLNEDIKNGDYSAPVIFFAKEKNLTNLQTYSNINNLLTEIEKTNAVEKTKELIKEFSHKAIENIAFIEDNLYKQSLTDLCKLLIKD